MRNALRSLFAVAIVSTVTAGLVAQTPSSSTPQSSTAKQVTLAGCVEKAPAPAGAAASASATATPAFILTNAAPAGTGGTVGTAGSAKPAAKYRLDADAAKLSPHVGHKVEITGTIDESSSASSPSSASSAATPPSASSSAAGMEPKFKVESVKMVAATCS